MLSSLLLIHSLIRWLVLASLLYAVFTSLRGYNSGLAYTPADNFIRHTTATIAHVQLIAGILLYSKSPVVKAFFMTHGNVKAARELSFFGVIHISLMLVAIILITVGSALTKRKTGSREKFKTTLIWFSLALFILVIAIPWPFSPLASRPYFRF